MMEFGLRFVSKPRLKEEEEEESEENQAFILF